jgi:predicted nucleic acid-binding protein
VIYLDSCVVIYAVEDPGTRGDAVRGRLARAGDEAVAVSPLVAMECLVGPLRRGDLELEARYRTVLALFHQLAVPADVFERAARLRAALGLRTPDAPHLATAQVHGCSALWTDDQRLHAASRGLAVDVVAGA